MIGHRGTGLDPNPIFETWAFAAVTITSHLVMLFAGSQGMPRADKTPSPYTRSSRPLELS